MTKAEKILDEYIKGNIEDYDIVSRREHTITLEVALKAINKALITSKRKSEFKTAINNA